jgi:hypothetical protein
MSLIHGTDISGKDIEWIVGRKFGVDRFAALCNAVAWAYGRIAGLRQLSFTERVNVRDSGIDAEWFITAPPEMLDTPLIKDGLNVFQYKQRDVSARSRAEIFNGLKHELQGAAEEVRRRTGRDLG